MARKYPLCEEVKSLLDSALPKEQRITRADAAVVALRRSPEEQLQRAQNLLAARKVPLRFVRKARSVETE